MLPKAWVPTTNQRILGLLYPFHLLLPGSGHRLQHLDKCHCGLVGHASLVLKSLQALAGFLGHLVTLSIHSVRKRDGALECLCVRHHASYFPAFQLTQSTQQPDNVDAVSLLVIDGKMKA